MLRGSEGAREGDGTRERGNIEEASGGGELTRGSGGGVGDGRAKGKAGGREAERAMEQGGVRGTVAVRARKSCLFIPGGNRSNDLYFPHLEIKNIHVDFRCVFPIPIHGN